MRWYCARGGQASSPNPESEATPGHLSYFTTFFYEYYLTTDKTYIKVIAEAKASIWYIESMD
jgi:hypothetical protein